METFSCFFLLLQHFPLMSCFSCVSSHFLYYYLVALDGVSQQPRVKLKRYPCAMPPHLVNFFQLPLKLGSLSFTMVQLVFPLFCCYLQCSDEPRLGSSLLKRALCVTKSLSTSSLLLAPWWWWRAKNRLYVFQPRAVPAEPQDQGTRVVGDPRRLPGQPCGLLVQGGGRLR